MTNENTLRMSTEIDGLDEILRGGRCKSRSPLVRGGPGCGKTTLGLHFLTACADPAETRLYITLQEPKAKLRNNEGSNSAHQASTRPTVSMPIQIR